MRRMLLLLAVAAMLVVMAAVTAWAANPWTPVGICKDKTGDEGTLYFNVNNKDERCQPDSQGKIQPPPPPPPK